jgi:hypothetical protein
MLRRVYAPARLQGAGSDLLAFFWGFANPPSAIHNNLGAKLGFDALELGMP